VEEESGEGGANAQSLGFAAFKSPERVTARDYVSLNNVLRRGHRAAISSDKNSERLARRRAGDSG